MKTFMIIGALISTALLTNFWDRTHVKSCKFMQSIAIAEEHSYLLLKCDAITASYLRAEK